MQAATRRQRSTTSPASQRRTRTPKPYLCVGVMEWEKWSLRDGEESIRGGKIPPPLEPAPPLTPIGTPVTPNLPRAGGPGPSGPGPMAARGGPDPQIPKPPPPDQLRNSTAARLATYVRRHRHPQQRRMPPPEKQHPESPIPHPGQGGSPSAEPPKKPTPREPPDAPGPYCHPTPTTKTTAGQNRDPHPH